MMGAGFNPETWNAPPWRPSRNEFSPARGNQDAVPHARDTATPQRILSLPSDSTPQVIACAGSAAGGAKPSHVLAMPAIGRRLAAPMTGMR